jgi:hypothetical protein
LRLYLSEILAAVGWGALALHLRRCRLARRIQEAWWDTYRRQMNQRWDSYSPGRLGRRDEN